MTKATDQIFAIFQKSIQDAMASKMFVASEQFERVDIARNIADLMESVSDAYATAMVELADLAKSETGNGNHTVDDVDTFRALVSEDASQYLIKSIRDDAFDMELELGHIDPKPSTAFPPPSLALQQNSPPFSGERPCD